MVVIHNGIVENYAELRADLQRLAATRFQSETDTETIAHLMEDCVKARQPCWTRCGRRRPRLEGSQAIVAMSASEPGVIVAARIGNAGGVVIGYGDGRDAPRERPCRRPPAYPAGGLPRRRPARAASTPAGATLCLDRRRRLDLPMKTRPHRPGQRAQGQLPALHAQGDHGAARGALGHDPEPGDARAGRRFDLDDLGPPPSAWRDVRRVVLIGMGTSLHAAMIAQALLRRTRRHPGRDRQRQRVPLPRTRSSSPDTLVVSVSQSGETVDVLEAMAVAKAAGRAPGHDLQHRGRQTTRVADGTVYTRAGLERGVASTKCFTTAIVALYALALRRRRSRGRLARRKWRERMPRPLRESRMPPRESLSGRKPFHTLANHFSDAQPLPLPRPRPGIPRGHGGRARR